MNNQITKSNCIYNLFFGITTFCTIISSSNFVSAQIIPDNTLPNNSQVGIEGNTTKIEGGTTAGGNLFHSFEKFGVTTGGEAHFNNAVDINNIITRVTGNSISNIDGLIKANGTANLFLINPNGIVFGENAKLDIGGSFVGSTADSIKFADDVEFSAVNPDSKPLLSVNVPLGLQYGRNPGNIEFKGKGEPTRETPEVFEPKFGLQVPVNKTLALIGGNILLEGATLKAGSGNIELGSVTGEGFVSIAPTERGFNFGFDKLDNFGEIRLSENTAVDASGNGAGDVRVTSQNLSLTDNSVIVSTQTGTEKSGGIVINSTESVNLNGFNDAAINKSFIPSGLYANNVSGEETKETGNITINTPQLIVRDKATVTTNAWGLGNAGNINIKANNLRINKGGRVIAATYNAGKGGNVKVEAENVEVIGNNDNGNLSELSAIAGKGSTGDGGNLDINTNNLLVEGGTFISVNTFGGGNGGNMTINPYSDDITSKVELRGFGGGLFVVAEDSSTGDAGSLTINTDIMLAENSALVSVSNNGKGSAGNLKITTNDLLLKNNALLITGRKNPDKEVGNLSLKTDKLLVEGGSSVQAGTSISESGYLRIDAKDVKVIGTGGNNNTTPSSLKVLLEKTTTGNGGKLDIITDTLLIKDGAFVSTSTSGKSNGGNLNINAEDVRVEGKGGKNEKNNQPYPSGLFTVAEPSELPEVSTGNAGKLTINTKTMLVKDGAIISSSTNSNGNGGDLTINATNSLQVINDGSDIISGTSSGTKGNSGNLKITTNNLLIEDGGEISSGTSGSGNGGNLTIDAKAVQLKGTGNNGQNVNQLSIRTGKNSIGNAGQLTINTKILDVQDGSQVAANTLGKGNGGNIIVKAEDIRVIGTANNGNTPSSLSASTGKESSGNAGEVNINTSKLTLQDGAAVSVEGFNSEGTAGKLTINADSIRLNKDALLSANTISNKVESESEQATININSQDIIMRGGSNIFTNAVGENVVGGNINIDTDFLIANENSDISANSENFRGGNVRIDAKGIFGTQFRSQPTSGSDITATGVSEDSSGNVEIITPQTDPTSGSIEFPTIPVDTEVVDACSTPGYAQSSFTITGKGSLPPSPLKPLVGRLNRTKLATLDEVDEIKTQTRRRIKKEEPIKQIVEAQGWVRTKNGEIILVAHNPQNSSFQTTTNSVNCNL